MKREDLIKGAWYRGVGLNRLIGCMGLWNGETFMGFQQKFGQHMETGMYYYEDMAVSLVEQEK